ncbi:MAG: ABC transporter substrate-binding protein [Firmicutes bacterium]|nr:ABC transporter substrate-binding protein [Bacillota bacterium]
MVVLLLVGVLPVPAAYAKKEVQITYWHGWGGDEKKVVEDIVAKFNAEHPNIEVVPVTVFGSYDKLLTAIAAGTAPDVTSSVWWYQVPDLASRGALTDLTSFARSSGVKASDYVRPVWESWHYKGKLYAMGSIANYSMIAYNKDLFKQAGLDPEKAPKTVAELDSYASKLWQVEGNRILRVGYYPSDLNTASQMFRGKIFDGQKVTVTSPQVIQAANWMRSYYDKYGYQAIQAFIASQGNYASAANPFLSGQMAMQDNWGEWIVNFKKWYAPNLNYGRFPYPTVDGSPGFANWGSSVWVLPTGSKHPKEAWEFIRWISSKEGSKLLALGITNASVRLDLNASPEFLKAMPTLSAALPLLREGRLSVYPAFPGVDEFLQKLGNIMDTVYSGQTTAEKALADLQKQY